MATIKITPTLTVEQLKRQFRNTFGGSLHVFSGNSVADPRTVLTSIGSGVGSMDIDPDVSVGQFEQAMRDRYGLKVNTFSPDDWVAVLDEMPLDLIKDIPAQATKAVMQDMLPVEEEGPALAIEEGMELQELLEQFQEMFGGLLKVYKGRSLAQGEEILTDIGASAGSLPIQDDWTVNQFEEAFQNQFGLRCRVYTIDAWVAVLPEFPLGMVAEIPKQATKAIMQGML